MTDNMDLIQKITDVRLNITKLDSKKTQAETQYKHICTKYGIKPATKQDEEIDEGEDMATEQSNMVRNMRNPGRSNDDEALFQMNQERETRRNNIELLKQSVEEARQEQM